MSNVEGFRTPGTVLKQDYMVPKKISESELSEKTGLSKTLVTLIVKDRRRITAQTALKLSSVFPDTEPMYWLHLQAEYDLKIEQLGEKLAS